jgi:hypothetical protein
MTVNYHDAIPQPTVHGEAPNAPETAAVGGQGCVGEVPGTAELASADLHDRR